MVVNGKRYKGGSMSIINGVVYVDGKKYDEEEPKGKVVSATREVVGDSKTFEITGEAEVCTSWREIQSGFEDECLCRIRLCVFFVGAF